MEKLDSELDRVRAKSLEQAVERVVLTLQAQGVERNRALEAVDEHVTFLAVPGARWHARAEKLFSRGGSDEHLIWFARHLHILHPDIGGTPVPFFGETAPLAEGEVEHAAALQKARQAGEAARQRVAASAVESRRLIHEQETARLTQNKPEAPRRF